MLLPIKSYKQFPRTSASQKVFFFPLNAASELTNLFFRVGGGREQPQHLCGFFSIFCSSVVYIGLPAHFSSGSTKYRDAKYHSSHMAFIHLAVHTPLTIYLG